VTGNPLQAVNPDQFAASRTGRLPAVEQIGPATWTIPLRVDSVLVPFSFCYALADETGGMHLIDVGVDSDENWELLRAGLAAAGGDLDAVRSVTATHLHHDHLEMSERVRDAAGSEIVLHTLDQLALDAPGGPMGEVVLDTWDVPGERRPELRALRDGPGVGGAFRADRLVTGGERLPIPGRDVRVVWTPGHTRGHICLLDAGEKLIFTGDHVLPSINPGLGLGGSGDTNPLRDYLDALDRIEDFDDHLVCPGHGFRFRGLRARCRKLGEHHRRRTEEIAGAMAASPESTVWQVARQVKWSAGWDALRGHLLASALRQTAMHIDYLAT
jgi:glyoxylase-like metal-dependent hydrolase (beta-lactamase superfamily II)